MSEVIGVDRGFTWEDRDSDYKVNKQHTVAKGTLEQLSEIYSQNLERDFCNEDQIKIKFPRFKDWWRERKIKGSRISCLLLNGLAYKLGIDPEKKSSSKKKLTVKYTDYDDFPIMIKDPESDEYFFIAPITDIHNFIDPRPWIIWNIWGSAEKPEEESQ